MQLLAKEVLELSLHIALHVYNHTPFQWTQWKTLLKSFLRQKLDGSHF